MVDPLHFEETLDSSVGGPIEIPYDVRELFGKAKPPVLVTVRAGQEHTYRSTVAVYGGRYYVPRDPPAPDPPDHRAPRRLTGAGKRPIITG